MSTASGSEIVDLIFIKKNGGTILLRAGYQYYARKKYDSGLAVWTCLKRRLCKGLVRIKCVASFVAPMGVDKLGRRILLLISSFGTAVSMGLLGMYFLLQNLESPVVDKIGLIPLLSLMLFMVTYCVGLGPLPWAIMGELFSIEVKAIAAPIATAFCGIMTFIITKYLVVVQDYIRFFIFGVCCVICIFFTLFMVPETKGKSFQEIQDLLRGHKTPKSEKA